MSLFKVVHAAIMAASLNFVATIAVAEELLESRLGELLGQERSAVAVVPDRRIAALTALPPVDERGVQTETGAFIYDRAFLDAQPVATGDPQWECLTEALYFEARGENVRGMFAVAEVILNRVDNRRFPDTICAVVNQGTGRKHACQFSYTCDGRSEYVDDQRSWVRVGKVARYLMDGAPRELTNGATFYHTKAVNPYWAERFLRTATIGFHHFYRRPTRTASN